MVQIVLSTHSPETTTTPVHDVPVKTDDGFSMGGAALGRNSETNLLGQAILSDVPGRSLAWIAYEATLVVHQSIEHDYKFAFVRAVGGLDWLELPGYGRSQGSGEWVVIFAGAIHRHEVSQGQSLFY